MTTLRQAKGDLHHIGENFDAAHAIAGFTAEADFFSSPELPIRYERIKGKRIKVAFFAVGLGIFLADHNYLLLGL